MTDLGCAKVPKTSRMLLHKKTSWSFTKKTRDVCTKYKMRPEHSQCEVIHTSTPEFLTKGDLSK
jgi:hypothetical protein